MIFIREYIKKIKGHKNSKGESAPYVIISHKDGRILGSFKSREDAKKQLRIMARYRNVNTN